jgi:hypothetical protein
MPEKNELPECPVCQTNKAVNIFANFNAHYLECLIALGGCGEKSGTFLHEAIAPWTRAAEKRQALAAKVPRLSKKEPDSDGLWWRKDGRGELRLHDLTFKADGNCYCSMLKNYINLGGAQWAKCLPPEMPEEEE